MSIVIYTPKVTNRIKYTLDFVFQQYFGIDYELVDNIDFTIHSDNFVINYSNQFLKKSFSIFQENLLLEDHIQPQNLFISFEQDLPVFFQTTENYDFKFDIFSAIFYLITRYEEYLPHDKDTHERYKSSNSILANSVFNFSPIVEFWLQLFKNELLKIKPNFSFNKYEFEYLPTFDIDNAFQYKGRNWLKNPPNIFKKDCRNVLLNKHKDAYDNFDFMLEELERNKLEASFFFLMNDDKKVNSNVSPTSRLLHNKINIVSKNKHKIGIHPSYNALENKLIVLEKNILEKVTSSTITIARQHFLKLSFPTYFRQLIEADIDIDYSLAYPNIVGFRAGCSRPFYYFDLEKNETTTLLIQPSCFMDATFEYYHNQMFNTIEQEFLTIFNQLIKINGKLVPIFHNDLFAKDIYRNIFLFINQQVVKSLQNE